MSVHMLKHAIPDAETIIGMQPDELAKILLPILKDSDQGSLHCYNFCNELNQREEIYPRRYTKGLTQSISEAWLWMINNGLLMPDPTQSSGKWVVLTRKANKINNGSDFDLFRKSCLFTKDLLHPDIAQMVWSNYLRGDYETAVFQAFKKVEVAVRSACGFEDVKVGVHLMRDAFHPEEGPLTDKKLPKSEREALQHLFAGALGSYKNPSSHRTVVIEDPIEAGEMLMLASHLLRIVDARAARLPAS